MPARRPTQTAQKPPKTSSPAASPLFELRRSSIQGTGAFALQPIPKDTRLIEYTGERITPAEADRRYDDTAMERHHTFLFSVSPRVCIDASVDGNDARFFNHSCEPNCEAQNHRGRIFLYTLRDVSPGEELCYDYAYEVDGETDEEDRLRYACRCGAPSCRGTILALPPEPPARQKPRAKATATKTKKTKQRSKTGGQKRRAQTSAS